MIFLELVPRDHNILLDEAKTSLETYPQLIGINVPDVKRLENRSYDSVNFLLKNTVRSIPHIRAMDHEVEDYLKMLKPLVDNGLKEILIVRGDIIEGQQCRADCSYSIDLINGLKKTWPTLNVYGALDPYRSTFEEEVAYCRKKIDAGCDGFFTQPFFDLNITKSYLETLQDSQLFVGLAPVLSENSKKYWEKVNLVNFEASFETTMDYNCALARDVIALTQSYNQHNYLMPITAPLKPYLAGVFTA